MSYKSFDDFYSSSKDPSFGIIPSFELKNYIDASELRGVALDLGCGDGRDTILLLSKGFDVVALDTSQVALNKLQTFAANKNLEDKLTTRCLDFTEYNAKRNSFNLITSATGLDHISIEQTQKLLPLLTSWLKDGGILYLMVHTIDDPAYNPSTPEKSELSNMIKHYFKHNELLRLIFDCKLRVLRYEERLEDDFDHGKPHEHGFATVIAKKQNIA